MPKNALTLDMKIAKEIEYRIDSGTYGEGDRLPSERALAEEFRVQRGTVRKALQFLAVRGRIVARKGSGYYISPRRITFDLNAFSSRKKIMEKTGKSTFVKLLTMEVIRVPEKMLRKTLWPEGTMAYKIMRLRYAAGQPEGLERAHIRCDIVPELSEEDVHNKSIYSFLKKEYGIEIARSLSTVSVVYTNGLESELLNTKFSKPVLRYEGIVFDRKNRPIEYFDDIILKDRVQFVKTMFNRLYEGIKEYIDEGRLLPGEKLPGEREFAEIAGISRGTARRIYTRLREEGYLTVVRGSGTYVRRSEQRRMNFEFLSETGNSGITAMLNSYKLSISSKVLNRGFTDESFFTNRLGLDEGSSVFFLHRVRYGDGEPLVVEYTYLPADEFQGIEEMDFSRVSLYDYMDARDRMPAYFNERFMIIDAPEREGKLLGVNPGDPLYYMEFVCFDRDKQRVEYTESYARCDKFQLNFSNRV